MLVCVYIYSRPLQILSHALDRMQQNARHTHPLLLESAIEPGPTISAFALAPALFDNGPVEPSAVQVARKARGIVPTPALEVELAVMVVA